MAYLDTTWAVRDPVIASKLQQMSDNDSYLQNEVDNRMPKGLIAAVRRITQTTGLTSLTDASIGGLSVTFTIPADRLIEIRFFARSWETDVADTIIGQQIQTGGLCVAERNVELHSPGSGTDGGEVYYLAALAAGTYTYTGGYIIYTNASPTTIGMQSSATRPSYIAVFDVGSSLGIVIAES